ncbi:GNAT family N-acetyltransferase [Gorillibacterium timonense]|uniref:GNAT family N-acetyltransferase n=1 Tax=Gorillibacterium timonense TaxID=1689269 RepID=UPI00071C6001|nr:GNAT family N-acetyltransferase [Gorillibacterium timonense]
MGISELELNSERLVLVCDTYEAMCRTAEQGDELAIDFSHAYKYHRELAEQGLFAEEDLIWYRTWTFYEKSENKIVGGGLFKGKPNENGYVEIGYGISDDEQRRGYATEGNGRLVRWALDEMNVAGVTAETERDNIASIRVLEKLGFEKTHETDEFSYWLKQKISG